MRILPTTLLLSVAALAACDDGPPPAPLYFEHVIQPILTASCVRAQGGCHKDDGTGNALGNLDLTSYESITARPDVIRRYGSYPYPLLLIKATNGEIPPIPYEPPGDRAEPLVPAEIKHAGGANIQPSTNAFLELQKWLDLGAPRDGRIIVREAQSGTGKCRSDFDVLRPDVASQIATVDTNSEAFKSFASDVEPTLTKSCAFATCHSGEQSDYFIACQGSGSDDASKFNFLSTQQFVAMTADQSQILLRTLSPSAGGISHTGGSFFDNKEDPLWKKWLAWATLAGQLQSTEAISEGQKFFNAEVMPVLLRRGCAFEACHSPGAANDFKLRAGSEGFFAPYALQKNYENAREFLVAEVPDVRHSRLVRKPVISTAAGGIGLIHRGGPPLQSPEDDLDPAMCPSPWTPASTPFCTVVEWHRRERAELLLAGKADAMNSGDRIPLVTVVRPPDGDRVIDFATFRGGADLQLSSLAVNALGAVDPTSASPGTSLLAGCPGVTGNVDVRGPDIDYAAQKVAFAMRTSEADSLDIYEVTLAAPHTCTKITDGNGQSANGLPIHNFDPMYSPEGSLVFASTRGAAGLGPTRSLKYLLPQTDLWRLPRSGDAYGAPEQMTSLRGDELSPAMMTNGQMTFTAEKASADFYQLSGRRINWDITDYHPLLAQRSQSKGLDGNMHPSIGYQQATEIREGIDRNFLLILSDDGTKGAGGTLATFNRSIGPFEADRTDITFLRGVTIVDPAATGRAGATQGAYRSPALLPDGRALVSYAPEVTDLGAAATVRYDLAVINLDTGARTNVANFSGGGSSRVEAVLGYKREPRKAFHNVTQLVFGGRVDDDKTHATVHMPDAPMLATLLGANLRSGRFVDEFRSAAKIVIYAVDPPPSDLAAAMAGRTGSQMVFDQRHAIGSAPLEQDGSVQLILPPLTPVYAELQDVNGNKLFTMSEQDQLGPGERISRGVPQRFFNSVCGGCHGSVSGRELEVAITPDALTGSSVSLARDPSKAVAIP